MLYIDIPDEPNEGVATHAPTFKNGEWHVKCVCGGNMYPVMLKYPEYLRGCDIPDCISCKTDQFQGEYRAFYSCEMDGCECLHWANKHKNQVGKPLGLSCSESCMKLRHYVHIELDHLWQYLNKSRGWVYGLLSRLMKIDIRETHVSLFNITQCKIAIAVLRKWKKKKYIPLALPDSLFFVLITLNNVDG